MRYRSIALGGGGMRGAAHIGALRALLETQGSLEFPDGIYGCSVGAIIASLVAFNIPFETLRDVLRDHYKRSWWAPTPSVKQLLGVVERKGLLPMDRLREMIVSVFTGCGIKDIETKRICDSAQPLFIVSSNMTTRRPAILTGEVPLVQAILCSCCVPGLFQPQVLYENVYLDAAVYVRRLESIIPPDTMIIQLFNRGAKITPKSSFSEILHACYLGNGAIGQGRRTCEFKDLNVGVIDDVTDKQRDHLLEQGYLQTLAFLSKMAAKEV